MNPSEFSEVLHDQLQATIDVLGEKADEYAGENDRLHNFKVAAALGGRTTKQALAGMMVKHTVSIYDMCWSDGVFDISRWEEKIGDHINYLILLKAIVVEEAAALKAEEEQAQ